MLLSTVSPGASPVQDLQPDAAQAPPGSAGSGADSFAGRLAQALDGLPQGQNLAADGTPLTRLPLGPSLEVITTGAAQPDGEALAAFAAAQGLDPEVVAWLFGEGGTGDAGAAGDSKEAKAEGALDAALQAGMLLPQGLLIPLPPQGVAAAGTAPTGDGAEGGSAGSGLSAALLQATLMPAGGWIGQQGLAGDAKSAEAAALTAVPDAAGSFAAAQALASAGMPAQVLGKSETNTKVDIGSKAFGMHVEVLSLEADPFTLSLLEQADQPVAEQNGASADAATANGQPLLGTGTAGAAAQAASSDPASETAQASAAQHRAEALHTLAQRLGEAVGQRVLGQIARGNWSMKLVLKPATLGDVEVDLRMRSGELDAAFRTMNPMTRELLNDGLSRLREVLTGAGMDVAGLQVGHGSSQSAGGNPTPRQPMASESQGITPVGALKAADAATPAGAVAARRTGSANWDVLV